MVGLCPMPGDRREICGARDLLAGAAAEFGQGVKQGEQREEVDAFEAAPGLRHGGK